MTAMVQDRAPAGRSAAGAATWTGRVLSGLALRRLILRATQDRP